MHIFVKLFVCLTFMLQSYSMVSYRDTGWGGRFSDEEVYELLSKKLYSDFSEVCGVNHKVELYKPFFHIIKNEKSVINRFNDIYDYEIEVEYINPFTDETLSTSFKVFTEVSRSSKRLILSYVDEPHYQCF